MNNVIKKSMGFTLMELMTSLAILSVLALLSTSFYSGFIQRNALDERLNTLQSAIKFSQNMAIIKHKDLILKPLSNSNEWGGGLQLKLITPSDDPRQNIPLREWHWPSNKNVGIIWQGVKKDGLLFNANLNKSILSGTFLLQQNKVTKKKLILNRLGRARVEHVT